MARNTIDITIKAEGRDKGKTFRLTEMPARVGERWALRAVNGAMRSGAQLPDGFQGIGMAAVAMLGMKAFLGMAWPDLEPLLDEMMTCVQIVMPKGVRPMVEEDADEILTLLTLRKEVFELHTGFFARAEASKAASLAEAEAQKAGDTSKSSTSPD